MSRIHLLAIVLVLAYAALFVRLAQLQLWRGSQYRKEQEHRSKTEQLIPAGRGPITTRDGLEVARDLPSLDLSVKLSALKLERISLDQFISARENNPDPVIPEGADPQPYEEALKFARARRESALESLKVALQKESWTREVAQRAGRPVEEVATGLFKAFEQVARKWARPSTPQTLLRGLDEATWTALRALQEDAFENPSLLNNGKKKGAASLSLNLPLEDVNIVEPETPQGLPGLSCTYSIRRVYPQQRLLAHVLGTLGELAPSQLEQLSADGVLSDHLDGRLKYWNVLKEKISDRQAGQLGELLHQDPRELNLGELLNALRHLDSAQRKKAATCGLADPVRWAVQPPRMTLSPAERLWMLNGNAEGGELLAYRRAGPPSLPDLRIGETGVEAWYNEFLRGKAGLKFGLRSEAEQPSAPELAEDPNPLSQDTHPHEGGPLRLSIDSRWQQACEQALAAHSCPAAIVVLDCHTGAVLALASFPDFDPNLFSPPRDTVERQQALKALLQSSDKPLLNRAVSDQYPLGSVMKTLTAAVGLEKGLANPQETFECCSYLQEGKTRYHCDGHRAHGTVNMELALRRSCNVYFYHLGARIGVEELGLWAERVGIGHRTGLDLPGEASGIFPNRAWRVKTYPNSPWDQGWARGKDYHLAIGQGYLAVTPLQGACLMATIANGGYAVQPHLGLAQPETPRLHVGFSLRTLAIVKQGLEEVVSCGTPGAKGTAYSAFHDSAKGPVLVNVAGKTGTADVGGEGKTPHAWFAGYAPAENPKISFCVFVQNGGHGGEVAAPIAARIFREVGALLR